MTNIKGSSDPNHYIFEINVGKRRIRHTTTRNLNDGFLDGFKIHCQWTIEESNSDSLYVGSACFRH